ncbi:nuclear GTP-binding protein [Pancytospora epiphaga]|nr:nuclear GTP-binding protein [Pancytospora epiphaga]
MINSGKPKRNSRGTIVKEAIFQKSEKPVVHIESKRSLFNNTKVVSQNELEEYRSCVTVKNPYDVLLSTGNVPYSIINNEVKMKKKRDLSNCFGSKHQAKRPNLQYDTLEEIKAVSAEEPRNKSADQFFKKDATIKGQSRRIWNELYKVLDSSDVVVHVLDARDPMGTKCEQIEEYIKNQARHKHLMYVLNKVDLVPTSVTAQWLRTLSKQHPVVAFHSNSLSNNYGKNNLINLLRQLKTLYEKQNVSVGFVGYPNSGKSSIINALRDKNVCKTAPVPGETRTWQYIALTREIYLIDSPGVVPVADFRKAVLQGAIRVEKLDDPDSYVTDVIDKAGKSVVEQTYGVQFDNIEEFFEKMARRYGKVVKGGEPNIDLISKLLLHDWHRGKIPYFTLPSSQSAL